MRGFTIGITGGTGTGKTALAGYLRRMGGVYYSVDVAAHALLSRDTRVAAGIVRAFGDGVGGAEGISRSALGDLAFASASALARLNALVHPALGREARAAVRRMRALHRIVVVEAGAILFELGLGPLVDRVVVVDCPRAQRLRRLAGRPGLSRARAARRLAILAPTESRMLRAARRRGRAAFVDGASAPGRLEEVAARLMEDADAGVPR